MEQNKNMTLTECIDEVGSLVEQLQTMGGLVFDYTCHTCRFDESWKTNNDPELVNTRILIMNSNRLCLLVNLIMERIDRLNEISEIMGHYYADLLKGQYVERSVCRKVIVK